MVGDFGDFGSDIKKMKVIGNEWGWDGGGGN